MLQKRSFFEKLTGAIRVDDDFDTQQTQEHGPVREMHPHITSQEPQSREWSGEESVEGELTVDVYQTPTDIIIKTMVAGVRPEDLDLSITRDMVTIKGKRESERMIRDDDYFHRELYWGSFSRTITLPQEIEIEDAEAVEKHGLLIIKLPKLDKTRQAKLKVRNNG